MLFALIAVLFIAGNSLGSPLANQYIESVLNTALRNELRALKLDPAALPDFSTEFKDKVVMVTFSGKANYTKGTLIGLSDVRRYSECQGPYYSVGGKSVNCSIVFNNLKIEYEGKLKYAKLPKVDMKGKANATNTRVFIEISSLQQMMPPTLKNFMFQQVGSLNIKFTGLGPLNKYTKFLEDGFRAHVEAEIFNSMSQRFQFALNKAVGMVPMPN